MTKNYFQMASKTGKRVSSNLLGCLAANATTIDARHFRVLLGGPSEEGFTCLRLSLSLESLLLLSEPV